MICFQPCRFRVLSGQLSNKFLRVQTLQLTQFQNHSTKPSSEECVYRGLLKTQIKLVKVFSISSSALGISLQPFVYQQCSHLNLGVALLFGASLGVFTYITPLLLHVITKKYVTELMFDHDTEEYTATTLTFFGRQRKLSFKLEDVYIPEVPGLFTTFLAKKTPLFVDPRSFISPNHFGRIMGYDKPLDFKLGDLAEDKQK